MILEFVLASVILIIVLFFIIKAEVKLYDGITGRKRKKKRKIKSSFKSRLIGNLIIIFYPTLWIVAFISIGALIKTAYAIFTSPVTDSLFLVLQGILIAVFSCLFYFYVIKKIKEVDKKDGDIHRSKRKV